MLEFVWHDAGVRVDVADCLMLKMIAFPDGNGMIYVIDENFSADFQTRECCGKNAMKKYVV